MTVPGEDLPAAVPGPTAVPEPVAATPSPAVAEPARPTSDCALAQILYDAGAPVLKPAHAAILDRTSRWLRDHPRSRVVVRGHADASGDSDANLRLSRQRADGVTGWLRRRGVAAKRTDVQALGEYMPIVGVATEDGRNRRVELLLRGAATCPATPR